jgi:hypothetical protein
MGRATVEQAKTVVPVASFMSRQFRALALQDQFQNERFSPTPPRKRPNSYAGDLVGVKDNGLKSPLFDVQKEPPPVPQGSARSEREGN